MNPRPRPLLARLLVAAFSLWLPMATASGASVCSVATSIVARPHLSCHAAEKPGAKHDCCCQRTPQIRAGLCGCHEGQSEGGISVNDPNELAAATWVFRPAESGVTPSAPEPSSGRERTAPDPHPPQTIPLHS